MDDAQHIADALQAMVDRLGIHCAVTVVPPDTPLDCIGKSVPSSGPCKEVVEQLAKLTAERDAWKKLRLAATDGYRRTIAKQAVLIEALKELAKAMESNAHDGSVRYINIYRSNAEVTALKAVMAAQTELNKENSNG